MEDVEIVELARSAFMAGFEAGVDFGSTEERMACACLCDTYKSAIEAAEAIRQRQRMKLNA